MLDLLLHLDQHLGILIQQHGPWIYALLFVIIFCETALVITPFLPGDSLLFVAGTFAALGSLDLWLLVILLCIAAIVGDTINYWIGAITGPRIFQKETGHFLNKKYLTEAQLFYEKHGAFTIVLARFMPIIRTFAPFVAGIGKMNYRRFIIYNVVGGISWVFVFILGGYFFGTIPVIKENLSVVIFGIIFVSILPGIFKIISARARKT